MDLNKIVRQNIKNLVPYSSARSEYKGKEGIFLDANENSFGSAIEGTHNRYPDPLQLAVKQKLAKLKNVSPAQIFLGNGSDEAIDILYRAFCIPGKDNVIINPPTYGMYEVSAHINDVSVTRINLTPENFQLDVPAILGAINANTKLIFVCCPNNPTATAVKAKDIKNLLANFHGIVVLDEAYIDFAGYKSFISELNHFPNLVVLQTFSKAWGMANLRLGIAYASEAIITLFNKIKPPYNVNGLTQQLALDALENEAHVQQLIAEIIRERNKLVEALKQHPDVIKIYPSEANFILIKTTDPKRMYGHLVDKKIVVRDRSNVDLCEGCLRITVGTKEENEMLLKAMKEFDEK